MHSVLLALLLFSATAAVEDRSAADGVFIDEGMADGVFTDVGTTSPYITYVKMAIEVPIGSLADFVQNVTLQLREELETYSGPNDSVFWKKINLLNELTLTHYKLSTLAASMKFRANNPHNSFLKKEERSTLTVRVNGSIWDEAVVERLEAHAESVDNYGTEDYREMAEITKLSTLWYISDKVNRKAGVLPYVFDRIDSMGIDSSALYGGIVEKLKAGANEVGLDLGSDKCCDIMDQEHGLEMVDGEGRSFDIVAMIPAYRKDFALTTLQEYSAKPVNDPSGTLIEAEESLDGRVLAVNLDEGIFKVRSQEELAKCDTIGNFHACFGAHTYRSIPESLLQPPNNSTNYDGIERDSEMCLLSLFLKNWPATRRACKVKKSAPAETEPQTVPPVPRTIGGGFVVGVAVALVVAGVMALCRVLSRVCKPRGNKRNGDDDVEAGSSDDGGSTTADAGSTYDFVKAE